MSAQGFMDEFIGGTAENAVHNRERLWRSAPSGDYVIGMEVEPTPWRRAVRLQNIRRIRPSRCGEGSLALDWLTALARKHGTWIVGQAEPTGHRWMHKRQLKQWYARHGFDVTRTGELLYRPESKR